MQLTRTQPRADLNDGKPHPERVVSPLAVMQALRMATGRAPIKTAKKALPR